MTDIITTDYYIVAVDSDGAVLATPATLLNREGLHINVQTANPHRDAFAFEHQGDSSEDKWESASSALAAIMPEDDE